MPITFDNSYALLPDRLYTRETPDRPTAPSGIIYNHALARELDLHLNVDSQVAILSGQVVPEGAAMLAQAYAGHQFGHWSGALGDGRAVMLGEVVHADSRWDVQLKGAGRTHWSRGGDGKAWLGPVLREYLLSEAMHALGIPTTRALAAVSTGDQVIRENGPLPGAVLTRVAPSHVRVGTFQYASAMGDTAALHALFTHTMARHYPDAQMPEVFLESVLTAQSHLVAQWMGVGFIHGVMNTDNAHIGAITLDYGPCAFMDAFHPMRVFSSIDRHGRYAFGNQAQMASWNMAQLATALLPLMDDHTTAIAAFTEIVHGFGPRFVQDYRNIYAAKLGISSLDAEADPLIDRFMAMMTEVGADFTESFRALGTGTIGAHLGAAQDFKGWHDEWTTVACIDGLDQVNPAVIPRNHMVEQMIAQAVSGSYELFHQLHCALATPFTTPKNGNFMTPPRTDQVVLQTFCGT